MLLRVLCGDEYSNIHRFNAYEQIRRIRIYGICRRGHIFDDRYEFKSYEFFIGRDYVRRFNNNVYSGNNNCPGGAK